MNKKYRLLKDLPGIKAGVIVHGRTPYTFCPSGGGKCFTFGEDEMIKNPDWFEEVEQAIYTQTDMINAYNLGYERIKIKEFSDLIRTKAQ